MAQQGDPQKSLNAATAAVLLVGGVSLFAGLIAELFDVHFLKNLGLGWISILFGAVFLVLGNFIKKRSLIALWIAIGLYSLDALLFLIQIFSNKGASGSGGFIFRMVMIWLMVRGIEAIRELNNPRKASTIPLSPSLSQASGSPVRASTSSAQSLSMPFTGTAPKPVSFVAHPASGIPREPVKREMLSKSLTPEILNVRFVAYRCEIGSDQFKAIYQNATQRELKWFEVSALVIRQFPIQAPWEGKLLLDVVPVAMGEEKVQPVRILSSTYVNYGFLPQGQSASTKENIRRLTNYILSQNRSIFIDPGTDYFVHAGQPPVRFLSMSQFTEYDSQYG